MHVWMGSIWFIAVGVHNGIDGEMRQTNMLCFESFSRSIVCFLESLWFEWSSIVLKWKMKCFPFHRCPVCFGGSRGEEVENDWDIIYLNGIGKYRFEENQIMPIRKCWVVKTMNGALWTHDESVNLIWWPSAWAGKWKFPRKWMNGIRCKCLRVIGSMPQWIISIWKLNENYLLNQLWIRFECDNEGMKRKISGKILGKLFNGNGVNVSEIITALKQINDNRFTKCFISHLNMKCETKNKINWCETVCGRFEELERRTLARADGLKTTTIQRQRKKTHTNAVAINSRKVIHREHFSQANSSD